MRNIYSKPGKKPQGKRAPGVDEIPTRLYKNASELFNKRLNELVNECLESGETPECLNTCRFVIRVPDKSSSST